MIKNVLSIIAVLVIGILVYNFFFGTPSEKQQSKEIFNEGKDLVVNVFDLLKAEKEKFDAGKYDQALDKIGSLFNQLKEQAGEADPSYLDRISELEKKRKQLENQLQDAEDQPSDTKESAQVKDDKVDQLNDDIKSLMEETQQILRELESN